MRKVAIKPSLKIGMRTGQCAASTHRLCGDEERGYLYMSLSACILDCSLACLY